MLVVEVVALVRLMEGNIVGHTQEHRNEYILLHR